MPDGTNDNNAKRATGWLKEHIRAYRLRPVFLLPLSALLVVLALSFIFMVYNHVKYDIDSHVSTIRQLTGDLLSEGIKQNENMLGSLMVAVRMDESLSAALAAKDRETLLNRSASLFAQIREEFGITHFYFTGPDRVNILRVHQPNRYGDVINRYTTLEAERTGKTSSGLELGPLGTFTLRLVTPWYAEGRDRKLLGYVELGMEISELMQNIQRFMGTQIFVTIYKEHLDRDKWEAGMRMLGRVPHWDSFPETVVSVEAKEALPAPLARTLMSAAPPSQYAPIDVPMEHRTYKASFLPLVEADGDRVGQMIIMADFSDELEGARWTIYLVLLISFGAGVGPFIFFYWFVGRINTRIKDYQAALNLMATHDELTGLYNHRSFQDILSKELARAARYGSPLSLFMIDFDHFKNVNDTYGHPAGDIVLKGLSAVIVEQARVIDSVCRYGGEELAVILPNTSINDAINTAERLRSAVERTSLDVGAEKPIHVTVSIGVAATTEHTNSETALVAKADRALYEAKDNGRNRVCCSRITS